MTVLRTLLNVETMIMLIKMLKWNIIFISLEITNCNLKLNFKIPFVFQNLKNYDSHPIMQELGKFNLKINVISNELEKCMSFTINNKLSFIDCFQFPRFLLDSLVKSLNKDDCKYLNREFDNNLLDVVKQKGFYSY